MRKFTCAAVGLLIVVFSTGCFPVAENSVTPLADAAQDLQLVGLWKRVEEDGSIRYLHIAAEGEKGVHADEAEPGLMCFWFVTHRKSDEKITIEKPASMRFFVSTAGNNHFANGILPVEDPPGTPVAGPLRYLLMRYKVDRDQLTVWGINFDATAAAIEAGELWGTVRREGKDLKEVQITDPASTCANISGPAVDRLFPDKGKSVFRRVE